MAQFFETAQFRFFVIFLSVFVLFGFLVAAAVGLLRAQTDQANLAKSIADTERIIHQAIQPLAESQNWHAIGELFDRAVEYSPLISVALVTQASNELRISRTQLEPGEAILEGLDLRFPNAEEVRARLPLSVDVYQDMLITRSPEPIRVRLESSQETYTLLLMSLPTPAWTSHLVDWRIWTTVGLMVSLATLVALLILRGTLTRPLRRLSQKLLQRESEAPKRVPRELQPLQTSIDRVQAARSALAEIVDQLLERAELAKDLDDPTTFVRPMLETLVRGTDSDLGTFFHEQDEALPIDLAILGSGGKVRAPEDESIQAELVKKLDRGGGLVIASPDDEELDPGFLPPADTEFLWIRVGTGKAALGVIRLQRLLDPNIPKYDDIESALARLSVALLEQLTIRRELRGMQETFNDPLMRWDDARAAYNHGVEAYGSSELDAAAEALADALKISGWPANALYLLGLTAKRKARDTNGPTLARARAFLEAYCAVRPDHLDAQRVLLVIALQQRDTLRAADLWTTLRPHFPDDTQLANMEKILGPHLKRFPIDPPQAEAS